MAKKKQLFQDFINFCKAREIPFVVSAANDVNVGPEKVADSLPQLLSTPTDTMIIVAAVDEAGKVYVGSVKDPTHLITAWAPGVNIAVRGSGGQLEATTGNSLAGAIVVSSVLNVFTQAASTLFPKVWSDCVLLWFG